MKIYRRSAPCRVEPLAGWGPGGWLAGVVAWERVRLNDIHAAREVPAPLVGQGRDGCCSEGRRPAPSPHPIRDQWWAFLGDPSRAPALGCGPHTHPPTVVLAPAALLLGCAPTWRVAPLLCPRHPPTGRPQAGGGVWAHLRGRTQVPIAPADTGAPSV
eukprot:scaffold179_cov368-Prasinococcus_capsulatus_cf.AAC.29